MKTEYLRNLGQSNIQVSPIGLGGNQFSGQKSFYRIFGKDISHEETNEIIDTALKNGINWFDTAEVYGGGRSESAIAAGLHAAGHEVIIGTKWFPLFRSASNITRSIDQRLHYLNGFSIDVYMIHNTWGFSSIEAEMDAMSDLVYAGKIRAVGVSNFDRTQMIRAHRSLQDRGLSLVVNQVPFSLLNRKIESGGVLEAARELGVTIVAYYPLGSGLLSGKYHHTPELFAQKSFYQKFSLQREFDHSKDLIQVISDIAVQRSVTQAQVALNWVINYHQQLVVEMALLEEVSRDFR
jgi:aryl-alcohol dehydrogenase-like predicted oxidoreductase